MIFLLIIRFLYRSFPDKDTAFLISEKNISYLQFFFNLLRWFIFVFAFILLPKIRKELIYCEHKSLQISRFAKLASFTIAGAMPQSANLLISCALHSHNDTSLRNLGINRHRSTNCKRGRPSFKRFILCMLMQQYHHLYLSSLYERIRHVGCQDVRRYVLQNNHVELAVG